MKKKSTKKSIPGKLKLYLRVLGYKKNRSIWAAHSLETDIVGYGRTFEEALNNLTELIEIQVGFAFFKGEPALLDRPAPIEIIETYNHLFRSNLQYISRPDMIDSKHRATSIPLPIVPSKSDFNLDSMQVS
jgi:predicted RNase H-like HicB family nuclease